jgi:peptidoglycan hydrolase CwlO-like protein
MGENMNLPADVHEAIIWILLAAVSVLVFLVIVSVKVIFAKISSDSGTLLDLSIDIKLIKQAQEEQKNWGKDLEELKTTTKLILQTQDHQSKKVDNLELYIDKLESRVDDLETKVTKLMMVIDVYSVDEKEEIHGARKSIRKV